MFFILRGFLLSVLSLAIDVQIYDVFDKARHVFGVWPYGRVLWVFFLLICHLQVRRFNLGVWRAGQNQFNLTNSNQYPWVTGITQSICEAAVDFIYRSYNDKWSSSIAKTEKTHEILDIMGVGVLEASQHHFLCRFWFSWHYPVFLHNGKIFFFIYFQSGGTIIAQNYIPRHHAYFREGHSSIYRMRCWRTNSTAHTTMSGNTCHDKLGPCQFNHKDTPVSSMLKWDGLLAPLIWSMLYPRSSDLTWYLQGKNIPQNLCEMWSLRRPEHTINRLLLPTVLNYVVAISLCRTEHVTRFGTVRSGCHPMAPHAEYTTEYRVFYTTKLSVIMALPRSKFVSESWKMTVDRWNRQGPRETMERWEPSLDLPLLLLSGYVAEPNGCFTTKYGEVYRNNLRIRLRIRLVY